MALKSTLLTALSGGLIVLSFPNPFDQGISPYGGLLACIALVPFFIALENMRGWRAFLYGLLPTLCLLISLTTWLPETLALGWTGVLLWLGLTLYLAAFGGIFAVLWSRWQAMGLRSLPLLGPSAWVAMEQLRSSLWSGFPGLGLGVPAAAWTALRPIASVLGEAGLHFTVFLANALIYEALRGRLWESRRRIWAATALLVPLGALLLAPRAWPSTALTPVALLQGGFANEDFRDPNFLRRAMDRYSTLMVEAALDGAQLIVWPEDSLPEALGGQEPKWQAVADFAKRHKVPVLAGAREFEHAGAQARNAAILVDASGNSSIYFKRLLVPFTEYVPFRGAWDRLDRWALARGLPNSRPGTANADFLAGDLALSVMICYESLFGHRFHDDPPGLLVVLAEGASVGRSGIQSIHTLHAMLRALEGGRYVVHASGSGPSMLIGPDGEVLASLGLGLSGYKLGKVNGQTGSPYRRWGWAFAWLCVGLGAAALWADRRASRAL